MSTKRHVFISYVQEDKLLVDRLTRSLQAHGVEVWLDREKLSPGVRWKSVIREAIIGGDLFICCFSEASEGRSRSYRNEELTLAIEELRLRPSNRSWFIPVLLSPCEVPARAIGGGETLHDLQWIELHDNWEGGILKIAMLFNARKELALNAALSRIARPPARVLRATGRDDLTIERAIASIVECQLYEKDWNPQGGTSLELFYLVGDGTQRMIAQPASGLLWMELPVRVEGRGAVDLSIKSLNTVSHLGFSDWRAPTIEEALSILGPDGRLDYQFGAPTTTWTSDFTPDGRSWAVEWLRGSCYPFEMSDFGTSSFRVRPVRSWLI